MDFAVVRRINLFLNCLLDEFEEVNNVRYLVCLFPSQFVLRLFALTVLDNLHPLLISALFLAAFYAKGLFLLGMQISIYAYFI